MAARLAPHSSASRHYYVLAFETPPPRIAPGAPVIDWTFVLDAATVALAVYFGKQFDSNGLIEGGGMFHVPELGASFTPYPHSPPYNDEPRADVATELNFAGCGWLTRWLTASANEAMRTVNSAGKYYLRALRSFGHDATSAYVDLVMAGEILADRHVLQEDELYDAELLAVLKRLGDEDAKLIKGRLFQVRRRFSAGLRCHLNARFFARTEAKGQWRPFPPNLPSAARGPASGPRATVPATIHSRRSALRGDGARGVALEYLDAVLPADLRAALTPRLDSATVQKTTSPRPNSRALDDLLQSKETIQMNLHEIRRVHDPDGEMPT